MEANGLESVVRRIQRAVKQRGGDEDPDAALLDRFVTTRDEAAFELLLRRHGPMVLAVCRRVLHNGADAEDAFQATFLVLVRKAAGIVPRSMVGNWLYGVAYRAALKAQAMNRTRRTKERQAGQAGREQQAHELHEQAAHELHDLLDAELNKLPNVYRVPIVLCDLEGRSIREAAQQLGWPQGTVASRLARGRRLLANRLKRLGYPLALTAVAALLSEAAAAPVRAELAAATGEAALLLAHGQKGLAGVLSAKVVALAEGLMKTMLLDKLKTLTAGLLLGAMLCGSAALLLPWAQGQEGTALERRLEPAKRKKAESSAGVRKVMEALEWRLTEVDADQSTLSVTDHISPVGADKPGIVIIGGPEGIAASGMILRDLRVPANAQISLDGNPAKLGDLKPGQRLTLAAAEDGATVGKITAHSPRPAVHRYVLKSVDVRAGTITATVVEKNIELEKVSVAKDAKIEQVYLTQAVRLQSITLADLQPGMVLSLQIAPGQDGQLNITSILATKPGGQ